MTVYYTNIIVKDLYQEKLTVPAMTGIAMETPLAASGHKFSLFPKVKTTTASSQALGGTHVWSKVCNTSKLFCKQGRHDVMESRLQAVTPASLHDAAPRA